MKRIELLGPSGVGKTTLYNKFCEADRSSREFLTLKEAMGQVAKNENLEWYNMKKLFYQFLLKTRVFNSSELGLARRIIRDSKLKSLLNDREEFTRFKISFKILYESLNMYSDPVTIYKRIFDYLTSIDNFVIIENQLPEDNYVLFDEGMLHKHPGITEYALKHFTNEELKSDPALNLAGIISCELSTDMIFEQALNRKMKGIHTFTQGPMTEKELKEHVEANMRFHQRKIINFENNNIPVLKLNTRDKFNKNMEYVNEFIRSLKSLPKN